MLLLLQSSDEENRNRVRELILHENHSGHDELAALLQKSGAMHSAVETRAAPSRKHVPRWSPWPATNICTAFSR